MPKGGKRLGALIASFVGVLLLWVAHELWVDLRFTDSRWSVFLVSLTILGVGAVAGSALALSGVHGPKSAPAVLLPVSPFAVLVVYFWYLLTDRPSLDLASSFGRFVVSEPVMIVSSAVVGVAIGLAVWSALDGSTSSFESEGADADSRPSPPLSDKTH